MRASIPKAAPRALLHTRQVEVHGYKRDDGSYDIEGTLIDVKSTPFENMDRGRVKPGDPIHEMWIRLTVDVDLCVLDVEARNIWGPYNICGDIVPNFKRLIGFSIARGWRKKVKESLGGTQGCTHMVELLGPIATTAFQTTYPDRVKRDKGLKLQEERPALINSCHAYASDSVVVKQRHPKFYTGPDG
ncbi:MAG: hypothetical protein CBB92_09070 [Flammeovirgaceae bacterium TMED32]|nr:MAG: hypothetical protein CBB92_09070 [Flammeovirgaceae bacterium TMED32]